MVAGRWTIAAAAATAGDGGHREPGPSARDGLGRLVDSSLISRAEGSEGEPRFRLLESIRKFGLERLEQAGEKADAHGRHAALFLAMAEELRIAALLPDGEHQLERLEHVHADLCGALARLEAAVEPDPFLRLASALSWFWHAHSHYRDGQRGLERALARDRSGDRSPPRVRAMALVGLARLL